MIMLISLVSLDTTIIYETNSSSRLLKSFIITVKLLLLEGSELPKELYF